MSEKSIEYLEAILNADNVSGAALNTIRDILIEKYFTVVSALPFSGKPLEWDYCIQYLTNIGADQLNEVIDIRMYGEDSVYFSYSEALKAGLIKAINIIKKGD
jgi:hypothetical protein